MHPVERRLAALLGTLVLLAYLVPFTLLTQVKAWYGAGLFWVLFVIVVAGILTYQTKGWKEAETPAAKVQPQPAHSTTVHAGSKD
ncbi:MAG: hypothetical protein IMX01_03495 [Limnochordaceae bacterium]|nr:hypothetical protein [Limnochordaceae bacterium]